MKQYRSSTRRLGYGFFALSALCTWGVVIGGCGIDRPFGRGPTVGGEGGASAAGSPSEGGGAAIAPIDRAVYTAQVQPRLAKSCNACHANPASTYESAVALVKSGSASDSRLYLKVTGSAHAAIWPASSADAQALRAWIEGVAGGASGAPNAGPGNPGAPGNPGEPSGSPALDEAYFKANVQARTAAHCAECHQNPAATFADAMKWVKPFETDESVLYQNATGHGTHPKVFDEREQDAEYLWRWIMGGKGDKAEQ